MTDTLMFWLGNAHLRDDERRRLIQLSRDLYKRAQDKPQERSAPDPRAQQAAHFRVDRGDIG